MSDYDQAVFDRFVAEGKSERVARAKARAAFVRERRNTVLRKVPEPMSTAVAYPPQITDVTETEHSGYYGCTIVQRVIDDAGKTYEIKYPGLVKKV